jgi:hypothetical protein
MYIHSCNLSRKGQFFLQFVGRKLMTSLFWSLVLKVTQASLHLRIFSGRGTSLFQFSFRFYYSQTLRFWVNRDLCIFTAAEKGSWSTEQFWNLIMAGWGLRSQKNHSVSTRGRLYCEKNCFRSWKKPQLILQKFDDSCLQTQSSLIKTVSEFFKNFLRKRFVAKECHSETLSSSPLAAWCSGQRLCIWIRVARSNPHQGVRCILCFMHCYNAAWGLKMDCYCVLGEKNDKNILSNTSNFIIRQDLLHTYIRRRGGGGVSFP